MHKSFLAWLVPGLLIGAAGCPDITVDSGEGVSGPVVEFDPAHKVLPFPSNLTLDPATGKVNLPEQCNESAASLATRTKVLNALDGFGTFELPMQATFSEAFDEASLAGKVVLYKRASGATAIDPATATTIPVRIIKGTTIRYANQTDIKACTDPQMVNSISMVPLVPLDQRSTYVAAILKGVKTAGGAEFASSFTWSLLLQDANPVTLDASGNVIANRTPLSPTNPAQLAQIQGIDLLYKAHTPVLAFLAKKHAKADILVAWEFNTQTVTDPLDPTVVGSLASKVSMAPLFGTASILGGATAEQFLQSRLPPGTCAVDGGPFPCQAVGDIVGGLLNSNNYQVKLPAKVPTGTTNPNEGGPIPGPFSAPVNAMSQGTEPIGVLGMIPCVGGAGCAAAVPANGWPVVVFGHGLGSSKTSLVAIGSQLAQLGYASVAIDFVAHDSRAVLVSRDASLGCGGTPTPATAPQCFAPFLSSDLAATRDNIRQSVLDVHGLVSALKACGSAGCGPLKVDVTNISYVGISLGGIMGSTAVATKPDFRSAVLNVPGVGWADVLENSQTNAIKCPLVDALIDAKILTGEKWNPTVMPNTGLCTTDAWKLQPGYGQFATIGRWVLDPADGANFAKKLATRKFLIQEVVGDQVVPNVATDNEAKLVGLFAMAGMADPAFPPVSASAAITTNPTTNKFIKYTNLPPNAAVSFPGNSFLHPSLLRPSGRCSVTTATICGGNSDCPTSETCQTSNDGRLGTVRLQTDAFTFLVANKAS